MQTIKNIILKYYSDYLINELEDNLEYRRFCEEHKANRYVHVFCKKVKDEKKKFEDLILSCPSIKSSLVGAFLILNKFKVSNLEEEFKIHKFFIDELLLPHCSDAQKSKYKDIIHYLENCTNDYFLSFTSRKLNPNEGNMVHVTHRHFIKNILNLDRLQLGREIREAERTNTNLLARAVNKIISQQLKGFYYPYHQENNQEVIVKLTEGCITSFTFIQIIQDIIFEYQDEKMNYCHWEYNQIKNCIPSERRFFILAEKTREFIRTFDNLHQAYEEWYIDYSGRDPLHITSSYEYNIKELIETKKGIEEKILLKIIELKNNIIKDIPD